MLAKDREESSSAADDLVRQIADSETFRPAPVMRTLLVYLWKHRDQQLSEYAIAIDALGRTAEFDPKTDSTVRVQIARLRAKLKEFYESAGETFPLRLSIPLGRHELDVVYRTPPPQAVSSIFRFQNRHLWPAAAVALVSAIAFIVVLAAENGRLKTTLPVPAAVMPRFWQTVVHGGRPLVIVVPSPLFFVWPGKGVAARDYSVTEFKNWPSSSFLRSASKELGTPELSQSWVGATEMTTAVKLLQYLEKFKVDVQLIESRKFPSDSFAAQNTIYLGMPRTAAYLDRLVAKTNFYVAQVEPDVIRSRNPKPGEAPEYRETAYASDRRIRHAIIALLPTRPEGTRSLLLLGRALSTASTMLLALENLKLVDEQWSKGGSPDAWEMVVEAEIYRDTVLKVRPVAFRAIGSNFWN